MNVNFPVDLQNGNPELGNVCTFTQVSTSPSEIFWHVRFQNPVDPFLVQASLNSELNPSGFTPSIADGMYVAVDKYGRMRYGLWSFVLNQMVYDYELGYYDEQHGLVENSQEVADEIFRLTLHPKWMKMNHAKLAT